MEGSETHIYHSYDFGWVAFFFALAVGFAALGGLFVQPQPTFTDVKSQQIAACALVNDNKQALCLRGITDE